MHDFGKNDNGMSSFRNFPVFSEEIFISQVGVLDSICVSIYVSLCLVDGVSLNIEGLPGRLQLPGGGRESVRCCRSVQEEVEGDRS